MRAWVDRYREDRGAAHERDSDASANQRRLAEILAHAELAVSEVPNAPSQLEWLNNRKSFSTSEGIQQHFVATAGEQIVGYGCIEHRIKRPMAGKPSMACTACLWLSRHSREECWGPNCSQSCANA